MQLTHKDEITLNDVDLQTFRYENKTKGQIHYEIYTRTTTTKAFITESMKTGKNTFISLWIDGYNIKLSNKYDYGYALHIFTDLINKFKK